MSDWQDATDPVQPVREREDGVLRADGAPPKAEKQKRRLCMPRGRVSASGILRLSLAASVEKRERECRDALMVDFAAAARKRRGR